MNEKTMVADALVGINGEFKNVWRNDSTDRE